MNKNTLLQIVLSLLLSNVIAEVNAQAPGCPNINAGPNQNLTCQNNCTNLTATILQTGQTTAYTVSSIPYAPPAAFNAGTELTDLYVDDIWGDVINLGFNFCFYGQMYNQAVVGANGLITFDLTEATQFCAWSYTAACPTPGPPPGGLYNNSIMGAYHDIDPSVSGNIYYSLIGAAPCRTLIVNYNNVAHFDCDCTIPVFLGGTCSHTTQQIVIYETTNVIEVYVQKKEQCSSWNDGNATIGIQDATGANGIAAPGRNTGDWTATNEAWRFTPSGPPNYVVTWYDQTNAVVGNGLTVNVCPTGTTTYTGEVVYTNCDGAIVTVTDDVTLTVAGGFTTNQNVTPETCSGTCDGAVTVTTNGGTAPYTFNLDGGPNQNNGTFGYLCSGNYVVNVSDAGGCDGTVNVVIDAGGTINVVEAFTDETCQGADDGTITLTGAGGTAPYGYDIGFGAPNATGIFTNLPAGNYNYTFADASQCPTTGTITIAAGPNCCIMTNTVASTDPLCDNACDGTITLTQNNGAAPVQFSIDNGATFQNNGNFAGVCSGNYDILIEDANGCQYTDQVTLTDPAAVTYNSATVAANCGNADGELTLTGGGGDGGPYQYSVDNGASFQASGNFTGLLPLTYDIVVEDNSGCQLTDQVVVPNNAGFTVSVTASSNATCNGVCDGTADMTATPGFVGTLDYDWIDLATNLSTGQLTANATGLCAGDYLATATDDVGCTTTDNVTITEPTVVAVLTSADATICIGSTTTLTATPNGGTPGYTYLWTSAPADPTLLTPAIANPTVAPIVTTVYTVNVDDNNNCPAPAETVTITVNPPLALNMLPPGPIDICPGETATMDMNATGGDGNYTYTWDGGSNPVNPPVSVTPALNTTYNFTVNDGCGTPPATQAVDVNIFLLPVINFTASIYEGCEPLRVTFTDNTQPQPANLLWNFGDPNSGTNNTSTGTTPTHAYNDPGIFDVTLIVTTPDGCKDSLTMQNMITVYPLPVADFSALPPSTDIFNPEITFNDNSNGAAQWSWDFGDNTTSTIENPSHIYGDTGTYTVWLYVESSQGCLDSTSNLVEITPVFTFYVPSAFTPNADGTNDTFFPKGETIDPDNYVFRIFNRWGQEIYASHTPGEKWDGTHSTGNKAQEDVYVWVADMLDLNGEKHKFYGRVTLYR